MAGYVTASPVHPVRLVGTGAVQCKAGILGGAAGVALDTELYGVYIQLNAVTAGTVTIAGMADSSGAAQNILLSGQIATDTAILFPVPWLNYAGAFVFTASIANIVWVLTRPYIGQEAPNAGGFELR